MQNTYTSLFSFCFMFLFLFWFGFCYCFVISFDSSAKLLVYREHFHLCICIIYPVHQGVHIPTHTHTSYLRISHCPERKTVKVTVWKDACNAMNIYNITGNKKTCYTVLHRNACACNTKRENANCYGIFDIVISISYKTVYVYNSHGYIIGYSDIIFKVVISSWPLILTGKRQKCIENIPNNKHAHVLPYTIPFVPLSTVNLDKNCRTVIKTVTYN